MNLLKKLVPLVLISVSAAFGGYREGKHTADKWWQKVSFDVKPTVIQNVTFENEVTFPGSVQITNSYFMGPLRFKCFDPNMPADLPPNLNPDFFRPGEGKDKLRL